MKEMLIKLVSKMRYARKSDVKTAVLALIVSVFVSIVSIYVLCTLGDSIVSGTIFEDLLILKMIGFYLNGLYLTYEIGVKSEK